MPLETSKVFLCISPEISNILFDVSQRQSKLLYHINQVFKWAQSKRYSVFPSDEREGEQCLRAWDHCKLNHTQFYSMEAFSEQKDVKMFVSFKFPVFPSPILAKN